MIFNPLCPPPEPGYFLTETYDHIRWRSTPDIRQIDDEIIALTVRRFRNRDYGIADPDTQERNRRALRSHNAPLLGLYRIGTRIIAVSQHPAAETPTVSIAGDPSSTTCSNT